MKDSRRAHEEIEKNESEIAGPDMPYYRTARYARGQLFVDTTLTSLAVNTFYNPSLCELVSAMISAPMSRWQVSAEWVTKSFFELFDHLLWVEQLLAVALFREQGGVPYLYTAPPGKETTILKGDLVICFGKANTDPPPGINPKKKSPKKEKRKPRGRGMVGQRCPQTASRMPVQISWRDACSMASWSSRRRARPPPTTW